MSKGLRQSLKGIITTCSGNSVRHSHPFDWGVYANPTRGKKMTHLLHEVVQRILRFASRPAQLEDLRQESSQATDDHVTEE
jgi:hypothetical protein